MAKISRAGELEEITLNVCLFISFLNNVMFLNLLQQRNVAVVDGLVVPSCSKDFNQCECNQGLLEKKFTVLQF